MSIEGPKLISHQEAVKSRFIEVSALSQTEQKIGILVYFLDEMQYKVI